MSELKDRARFYNPSLKQTYSAVGNANEEKAALRAMQYFVTDPEGSIYALTPMVPELFAALLKARYSRTELSARQLLWREFVSKKRWIPWKKIRASGQILDEVLNYARAEAMAERILLQYGDESVFELAGAHVFFDRISQVAAKVLEDTRIGLSPLEKSTRYVIFDQKGPDGDYSFFKEPTLMDSPHKNLYLKTNRDCFELYAKSLPTLQDYFRQQIPLDSQTFPDLSKEDQPIVPYQDLIDEKSIKAANVAYNQSIKAKACDVARVLLPASTLTNVGIFGNARALGYSMLKMSAHNLGEMQMLSAEGTKELKKGLPKFFDVVDNEWGQAHQDYLRKTEETLKKRAKSLLKGEIPRPGERIVLVEMDSNPEVNIAAALLYPHANLPLKQLIEIMKKAGPNVVGDVLYDSLKFRGDRRHKPPRAFEIAGYELVFDILGNFGIYRDLQRQRMLTQQHQNYTTEHGFDMPEEFAAVGLDKEFTELMGNMKSAHTIVVKDFPTESQYLTTLANYMRWYMGMNLREGFWVTELRTVPQGHFSYRTIAQEMYKQAQKRYPILKGLEFKKSHYVNLDDYSQNLERMQAMQRIQVGLAQIEEKYS